MTSTWTMVYSQPLKLQTYFYVSYGQFQHSVWQLFAKLQIGAGDFFDLDLSSMDPHRRHSTIANMMAIAIPQSCLVLWHQRIGDNSIQACGCHSNFSHRCHQYKGEGLSIFIPNYNLIKLSQVRNRNSRIDYCMKLKLLFLIWIEMLRVNWDTMVCLCVDVMARASHLKLIWDTPNSLNGCPFYCKISQSLEAARFRVSIFQSLWNFTGVSAAQLPKQLANFRAIR